MAKRFTDTNKYKKPFIRGLQGAYKLLWDYLYLDCDHAGIWIVDFEIAQIYLGDDMQVSKQKALHYFNVGEKRIIEVDGGTKWFIKPFIDFQYGELNELNRAHNSIINILKKHNLEKKIKIQISPLEAPSKGLKNKDKDKEGLLREITDKDLPLIKDIEFLPEYKEIFLTWLRYKRKRGESYKDKDSTFLAYKKLLKFSENKYRKATLIIEDAMSSNYAGFFELKDPKKINGKKLFIIDDGIRYNLGEDGRYYHCTSGEVYNE